MSMVFNSMQQHSYRLIHSKVLLLLLEAAVYFIYLFVYFCHKILKGMIFIPKEATETLSEDSSFLTPLLLIGHDLK